jgi:hypothetical protein
MELPAVTITAVHLPHSSPRIAPPVEVEGTNNGIDSISTPTEGASDLALDVTASGLDDAEEEKEVYAAAVTVDVPSVVTGAAAVTGNPLPVSTHIHSATMPVAIKTPRLSHAGAAHAYLHGVLPALLSHFDFPSMPWNRVVKYKRRQDASGAVTIRGSAAVIAFDDAMTDTLLGESKSMGAFFLYELARGDVSMTALPHRYRLLVCTGVCTGVWCPQQWRGLRSLLLCPILL